jgi:hypothetical protein
MPSPVNSRRFGLYPLAARRGVLPVDPVRGGGGVKYIGTFSLGTGSQYAIANQIDVGPPANNKILVIVPTAFINNSSSIDYLKVDGRNAAIFDNTQNQGGQSVPNGICYLPWPNSKTKATVEVNYNAASGTGFTNQISVYNVISPSPVPAIAKKLATGNEFARLSLGKGAAGIFCSGSGQPINLVSLSNGVIDYNNSATGRITHIGRVINPSRPLVMEGSDGDGFGIAAVCWN